jgi:ferredoxin-NADP reductase
MEWKVRLLEIEPETHDVKRLVVEKPEGYTFTPGQATMLSLNRPGWEDRSRPFTFTSMNEDPAIEFIIKIYPEHDGVTKKIQGLKPGDEIFIREPFGTINYKGRGVFIAGGAGITPFIAIFRDLRNRGEIPGNTLIYSNRTSGDVILEKEIREMFRDNPKNLVFTLTREEKEGFENSRVNESLLKEKVKDFSQNFYICGPPAFTEDLKRILQGLGADVDEIVFEGKVDDN